MGNQDSYILDTEGRVFLTLMKLKLNCSFLLLSLLFDISKSTCLRYFTETLSILTRVLENFIYWPTRDLISKNLPQCFRKYLNTRVTLDCTEIPVYSPASITCRTQTYSFYYGRHTLKILLGVTPNGLISFVSDVYGGKASDAFICGKSGVINKCEKGDAIMVDKGFCIDVLCTERCIELIRPPFKRKDVPQLSSEDCLQNVAIACARVHIERVNERIKNFKTM